MKTSVKVVACMAALAVLMVVQSASAQAKLEGVWRITEVTTGGENAFKIGVADTHPNLLIITKKYFSFINMTTPNRPDMPEKGATAAQAVAAWSPLVAWSGTYEFKGNIFTARNIAAKNPWEMKKGNFSTNEIKFEGDNTFTTTPKTNQDGPIANPMITKYVRVE
jgi:hypothetical protein